MGSKSQWLTIEWKPSEPESGSPEGIPKIIDEEYLILKKCAESCFQCVFGTMPPYWENSLA